MRSADWCSLGGRLGLMALVSFGPLGVGATTKLSLTLAVDPPDPSPNQVVSLTSTVTDEGPDAVRPVRLHLQSSWTLQAQLPPGCWVDPICQAFPCDLDSIYCTMGDLGPGSTESFALQFEPIVGLAVKAHVTGLVCEVDPATSFCDSSVDGDQAEVWVPPQPAQSMGGGGCSTGAASAPSLLAAVLALRRRRRCQGRTASGGSSGP